MSNAFGTLLSSSLVEDQLTATLRHWLPTYLAEASRQAGEGTAPSPISNWNVTFDLEKWPSEKLPALTVLAMGLDNEPTRRGFTYDTRMMIGIAVVFSANEEKRLRALGGIYNAAVRGLLVQKGATAQTIDGVDWRDEEIVSLSDTRNRSLAVAQSVYSVYVPGVQSVKAGPLEPVTTPVADDPVVLTTHIELEK